MKIRLIVILVLGLLLIGGIGGGMLYLDSQVPKGDPKFERTEANPEDTPELNSPTPQAPTM